MSAAAQGQVIDSAAEVYEEFFLPALFEQWATPVLDAAEVGEADQILDVACGTGVVARAAAARVGPAGGVIGVDINEGMLSVARAKAPGIEWQTASAESLPFDDARFDAVVCQFALMFFENQTKALQEMFRVLRPGGCLAVAVWDCLDATPGYAAMTELLQRLFGDEAADALRAPFNLGDASALAALFSRADLPAPTVTTKAGAAKFPSIASWVHTDVKGWTLADMIDDAQFQALLTEAEGEMARFVAPDGSVRFNAPAHIATVAKP